MVISTIYPREDPVQGTWGFDYEKLFSEEFAGRYGIPDPGDPSHMLDLCELTDRGMVNEVWIYVDGDVPDAGAAEILELKPYYDDMTSTAHSPCRRPAKGSVSAGGPGEGTSLHRSRLKRSPPTATWRPTAWGPFSSGGARTSQATKAALTILTDGP